MALALCLAAGTSAFAGTAKGPLGKAEFQRRANTICKTTTRKVNAIVDPNGTSTAFSPAAMKRWVSLMRAQNRGLSALTPPSSYAIRYRNMLAKSRAVLPLAIEAYEAQRAGNKARSAKLYEKAAGIGDERGQLANSMGLFSCGTQ